MKLSGSDLEIEAKPVLVVISTDSEVGVYCKTEDGLMDKCVT
jgi:hypothetical protein